MINTDYVKRLRKVYPEGSQVRVLEDIFFGSMVVKRGDVCTIKFIDDSGQLHTILEGGKNFVLHPKHDMVEPLTMRI